MYYIEKVILVKKNPLQRRNIPYSYISGAKEVFSIYLIITIDK